MGKKSASKGDKRRGWLGTVLIHALMLLVFALYGLTEYDPKPEDGILINFGTSEFGSGNTAGSQAEEQQVPETNSSSSPAENTPEQVDASMTQDVVDAPSLQNNTPKQRKPTETPPKPKENEQPKPSDELSQMLNQVQSSASGGGEGERGGSGDQGDPTGDPNSPYRTGSGTGTGGSGNYMLGNRQALQKPKPIYECPDEGRVVVKIYVDQNGIVKRAIPGERIPGGATTTTTSSCLYDRAKAAAMNTTWQADADAPAQQAGYIVYNFKKR